MLVTEGLAADLDALGKHLVAERGKLRAAEARDRVALHLSRVIQRAIAAVDDAQRVAAGIALARALIDVIDQASTKIEAGPFRTRAPARCCGPS